VWGVVSLGAAGVWVALGCFDISVFMYVSVSNIVGKYRARSRSYGYQTAQLSLHLFSNSVLHLQQNNT
jgi:hypothetical protein